MNKTAQDIAQKIAKQAAEEPFEILKNVPDQVFGTGVEKPGQEISEGNQQKLSQDQDKLHDQEISKRLMEAYEREIDDIKKQNLLKDLQARISSGEEVSLGDYPDLSLEQKQVLKAQMEVVRAQMLNAKNTNDETLIEPASKKGRQLFSFGKKQGMKNEQTRVEKPVPPSG